MTPTTPVAPPAALPRAAAEASPQPSTKSQLSADFDTFLRMLTVQLQNQDPLNPMESTEFSVQLATFSSLEQQVVTNDLLEGLGERMSFMGLSQLSGWVGMEARADTPVGFDGRPVTLVPEPDKLADRATLIARDMNGRVVASQPVPLPAGPLEWHGVGLDGTPLPKGVYRFDVESYSGEDLLGIRPVESYTRVTEARLVGGETVLVMAGGQSVPAASVTAIRQD